MHLVDTTLFYSPTSGGVRRYLNAKHEWFRSQEHWQHTLLVPGDVTLLERGGVSSIAGPIVPGTFNYRLPLSVRRWRRMLEQLEPDLVEAGDAFHPAWCAASMARERGIPAVAFFHSHLPRLVGSRCGDLIGRSAGRYVRWLYDRFDMVLAPSRIMCEYLDSLGVKRVQLQPLGVDTDVFHPSRRNDRLRRDLGVPARTRVLAYAGRFSGEKNIPVLLDAFARLGREYHLLLVGGGESRKLADNVTVWPYRRDSAALASALASADALVHAGTAETFGLVILEAMACGRPVVGVNAGAAGELIDERVGIANPRADGATFAQSIRELYDRDVEALGAAARERVLARFSWNSALQHQIGIYSRLLGLREPGAREHAEPAEVTP